MAETATLPAEPVAEPVQAELSPEQPISIDVGDQVFTGVGVTEEELREGLPKQPERKPTRGQKRFDELTREREDANRAREAAEAKAADLEARLKALEEKPAASAPVAAASSPAVAPPNPPPSARPAEPNFEQDYETQVGAKYSTYGAAIQAFQRDHTAWNLQQIDFDARIRQSIEADRASRTVAEQERALLAKGSAAYRDFDAVVARAAHFTAQDWPLAKIAAIRELDGAEHVLYALAKDPALSHRLRDEANPIKFGQAIAALIPSGGVASPASTPPVSLAVAPPPMQPVGSGSKTQVLSASDLAERSGEDYDSSGFREQIRRERNGRFR